MKSSAITTLSVVGFFIFMGIAILKGFAYLETQITEIQMGYLWVVIIIVVPLLCWFDKNKKK